MPDKLTATAGDTGADRLQRIGPLVGLPGLVEELGVSWATFIATQRISADTFEDPNHRSDYADLAALLDAAAKETSCDHLGLLLGSRFDHTSLGLPGQRMRHSCTLDEALTTFVSLQNLNSNAGAAYLHKWGDSAVFGYGIYGRVAHGQHHAYPLIMAIVNNMVRGLAANAVRPTEVHLSIRRPPDDSEYRRILGVPVRFDQPESGVYLRRADLSQPVAGADPQAAQLLDAAIRDQMAAVGPNFSQQVLHRLRPMMLRGEATSLEMATQMGCHVRTLSRRLAKEGVSFQLLLDQVRHQTACELLALTDLKISEIAHSLKYSAHAPFIEAFRRWCGQTPSQWRQAFLDGRATGVDSPLLAST
jgi:AraC-like DNA-binding protein